MSVRFPMWLSPASAFLASVGDPLVCAAPGASPFFSPTEFLLPASSGERCVQQQRTNQPASDSATIALPSTTVNIEQCLSRTGMNSLWTLIVAIIKMQQRKYYWQGLWAYAEGWGARRFDYELRPVSRACWLWHEMARQGLDTAL